MTALLIAAILGALGPGLGEPEEAYRHQDYAKALTLFAANLPQAGERTGEVLYHMGNCAFRLGRYPEAVLHYRRAQLRLPRSEMIAFNLRMAERRMSIERQQSHTFGAQIESILQLFTRGQFLILVLVVQTASLIALVFMRKRPAAAAALGLLTLLSVAGSARLVSLMEDEEIPVGVILSTQVEVRTNPHATMPVTLVLEGGEAVTVNEHSDRWARITHSRGEGWIPRADLGIVD